MKDLKLLSDETLMALYKNAPKIKMAIIKELSKRGIELSGKIFKKRALTTANHIPRFLKDCGFDAFESKISLAHNPYGSGVHEYWAENPNEKLYNYQVNAIGLSEITAINDPIIFSINGIDPSITPLPKYTKQYPSFIDMVLGEQYTGIFNKGLLKWNLTIIR